MATFRLQRLTPPPKSPIYAGTFVLDWNAIAGSYKGGWTNGVDFYNLNFFWNPTTSEAHALASFDVDVVPDNGSYAKLVIPRPPHLMYHVHAIELSADTYLAELLVTG